MPNVTFWTYKKTSCLPAANKAHKRRPRHSETAEPWGTDRACGPRPPVPNVTKTEPTRKLAVFQPPTRPTNGALATAKQQGPEGRTGPAGHGPQCLTWLSEPTKKQAVFQPPTRPTNGALATAKQQGPEGRTGPAGHGPQCLTSLSEPTRRLAIFQPPTRPTNGALATAKQQGQQGPEGRNGGPRPPVPNLTFWTDKKTSCLPAANKAHKRRPRHSETCGPRPPVPNVTFWTYKKTSCLTCLPAAYKAHTRRARHTETAGPWGTDRACGPRPPVPNVTKTEPTRKLAVFQPPTRPTNGALATAN